MSTDAKSIFILGCGTMQLPALNIARELGWTIAAADGDDSAVGRSLCDRFFHVDLKDIPGLINAAREFRDAGSLDGVLTAGTDFSLSVALVARSLGLPGHSPDAARLATDKSLMRRRFREAGVPSPAYAEIPAGQDAAAAVQAVPGPWVVKPVDSMGARGVVLIQDAAGLQEALAEAQAYSRTGRAIVESFIPGPEFSLDALVENGRLIRCGLADRHIVYPPRFIEIGHTIPSSVDKDTEDSLWRVFEQGIKALGLTHGAAKGDIKLSPQGPVIGEIAARLSGGYMSGWTWPYASGVKPTLGALNLAVGLPAGPLEPVENLVCAEKALVSIDGRILAVRGRDRAARLPGVKDLFIRYSPGDTVRFPRNNVEKIGNIIAVGPTRRDAEDRALNALRTLKVHLDPAEDSTGHFLMNRAAFPPDAFPIPCRGPSSRHKDLCSWLERLWDRHPPKLLEGCPEELPLISPPPLPDGSPADSLGRSIPEVLHLLEEEQLIRRTPSPVVETPMLSAFWKALIRGGLAGARWYLTRKPAS